MLDPLLGDGDFLLNLSVDVSSVALIKLCQDTGALYLDTCIEPWAGGYTDPACRRRSARTTRCARARWRSAQGRLRNGPTAVMTHGANPGLVSHFVKQALLDIARDTGRRGEAAAARGTAGRSWRRRSGIKVIHIAERDTQVAERPEEARRVRQHLVDRRLRRRRLPAGRAWLGHA